MLKSLVGGATVTTAGYLFYTDSGSNNGDDTVEERGFDRYRYEGRELVVDLQEFDEVEAVTFLTSVQGETTEHESVSRPGETVRFPVILPDRLETRMTRRVGEYVRVTTPAETRRLSVGEPVHGAVRDFSVRDDGQAEFAVENLAAAPILTRFVAIHGDEVPNPTVNPHDDSFDREQLGEPNVVATGGDPTDSGDRSDLVVPPGETISYRSTGKPFTTAVGEDSREGMVTLVYGAGGSSGWSFG